MVKFSRIFYPLVVGMIGILMSANMTSVFAAFGNLFLLVTLAICYQVAMDEHGKTLDGWQETLDSWQKHIDMRDEMLNQYGNLSKLH